MSRADRGGRPAAAPWSGQVGWHVADWGPLGWAETAVKGSALAVVVVAALVRLAGSGDTTGWSVPADHRLSFWLIAVVAVGYLVTLVDRIVDREVISLGFVVATLIGYWALVWLAGLSSWPAGLVRAFAVLMAVGEAIKVAYFVTTGARVRQLPRPLPIVMTSMLAVVHVVIAAAA